MSNFKKLVASYKDTVNLTVSQTWGLLESMHYLFDELEISDKDKYWKVIREMHEEIKGKHFDECFAIHQVKHMFHTKIDGKVCYGEMITYDESCDVYDRYKKHIHPEVTKWDVYVALNAQSHDYDVVYNQWFDKDKDVIKEKIIETAIVFWFKDEDAPECKIWDYFND